VNADSVISMMTTRATEAIKILSIVELVQNYNEGLVVQKQQQQQQQQQQQR
jgi:hypothetical protein